MAHIEKQLVRVRKRLEGAKLYAGFSGNGPALELVARLERVYWRLDRLLMKAERKAA
ncbi:MAG: hypothetical protein ACJ8FY_12820 [Gemmataceae bacterium]